ncbi:hypothetical protein ATCC19606_16380 [Acinetobacter baumannii]|uniref:Uncharacterized protein n=1 Tax=Acinetobacter baumannii TaxID=470 RepID=A0A6F8TFU6_ACIBA|nr:hypothetical protein ATCC19606_16380 [Acinetobacter baumannii]
MRLKGKIYTTNTYYTAFTIVTGDMDVARWTGRHGSLLCSTKVFVTFDLSKVRYRLYNRPMDITINYSCDVIR